MEDYRIFKWSPVLPYAVVITCNFCPVVLTSHASKAMLKILQARLQQYVNQEIPDIQAGF